MKERYEWINTWSDETTKKDLPRIALIGDSITRGYQSYVRELLRGKCYVDYLATSYAIDTAIYNTLVEAFILDNHYDIIHFNHGLHGKHMDEETYREKMSCLLQNISSKTGCKVILATTTAVREQNKNVFDASWMEKVTERNKVVEELAQKYSYNIDNLYELSIKMPEEYREKDGFHYTSDGYARLADKVVKSVTIIQDN